MKKNRMMRLASILLVCVLMTTSVISGTFAKYTSTTSGNDKARVAKWSIEVEDTQIAVTGANKTITFNLFDYTDSNVAKADNAKLIAPGTTGSFAINIENLSEVNAEYTITLSEDNEGNIPLQYSVDNKEWKDSIAELTMGELTKQPIAMKTGTAEKTVYWRWVFDNTVTGAGGHNGQDNGTDTKLGVDAQGTPAEVTITATILVEQVD